MAMSQIDPSIYDDLLTSGAQIGGMDPQIQMQQAIAQRLRAAGGAPAGAYQSGRRAVAPNPLEYLAGLANQGVAGSREASSTALQQQQKVIQMEQVQKVIQALRQARQAQVPPTPAQPMQDNRAMMDPSTSGSGAMGGPLAGY